MDSTMSLKDNEFFQPPLTLFTVWGTCFILILLYHPAKMLVVKFCKMLGIPLCDCDSPEGYDLDYEDLSDDRKQEIDSLRTVALLRYLARFTVAVTKENMVLKSTGHRPESVAETCCLSDEISISETMSEPASPMKECNISLGALEEECSQSNENGDIEMGGENNNNVVLEGNEGADGAENDTEDDESTQYTHISLPYPGYCADGKSIDELLPYTNNLEKPKRSSIFEIFRGKEKEEEPDPKKELKVFKEKTERRNTNIFCAVCLMEYEISDRVCWSSNTECTHAFHEDCIVQWLVSLGRTKSKHQSFTDNSSEKKLLFYPLECPCCRQSFIRKSAPGFTNNNENV